MKRWVRWTCALLVLPPLLSIPVGYWMASGSLHPPRRPLTAQMITQTEVVFHEAHATREDLNVTAADGTILRGWLVRPQSHLSDDKDSLDYVLVFHGIADNRMGVFDKAEFLVRAGYGVVLMDSRAHGESGGAIATLGWKERDDVRAIISALKSRENVRCIFALGVSMGAAIALQAAGEDARIDGVIAEAPFSSLREASYDYAAFHLDPWLARIYLRPGVEAGLWKIERESGFKVDAISPEHAVAARAFPVFLIGDEDDSTLPARHVIAIYKHAKGPKRIWIVAHANHASGMGVARDEYERRCLDFLRAIQCGRPMQHETPAHWTGLHSVNCLLAGFPLVA
ncbi:MAG: alpha/beta fold hydrolase [Candidatus Acidiferrales bacterium]